MAKKTEMNKMLDKYGPMLKKLGDDLGDVAKKGEEGVIKISKVLKIQMDMLGVSLQREKLYYEIGKEVAAKMLEGDEDLSSLNKYKKKLSKIQSEGEKKKKTLSRVVKPAKKGTQKKKIAVAKKKTKTTKKK